MLGTVLFFRKFGLLVRPFDPFFYLEEEAK